MKTDRFGNFRYDGYNRDDFLFCKCVPARAKLRDPCRHIPNPKCPSCGGYGEIPESCASQSPEQQPRSAGANMNNELIERIDREREYLTEMLRITVVGTTLESELIRSLKLAEDCKAALTQQQEAEPFGWFTEDYADDKSATTYSAEVAGRWRAKGWPVTALYLHPPKPAAQPQVQEGYQLVPIELEATMAGKIVDNVFDGALEDWTVINDIWDAALSAAKEEGR